MRSIERGLSKYSWLTVYHWTNVLFSVPFWKDTTRQVMGATVFARDPCRNEGLSVSQQLFKPADWLA